MTQTERRTIRQAIARLQTGDRSGRWFLVTLFEKCPPPAREGMRYEATVRGRDAASVARRWTKDSVRGVQSVRLAQRADGG